MATYKDVQVRVRAQAGFVPKTCWIADVKAAYGLTRGPASNRISAGERKYPCPPDRRGHIEDALRHFGDL